MFINNNAFEKWLDVQHLTLQYLVHQPIINDDLSVTRFENGYNVIFLQDMRKYFLSIASSVTEVSEKVKGMLYTFVGKLRAGTHMEKNILHVSLDGKTLSHQFSSLLG
ncbi:hypothetical protein J6590_075647 [Homalodisca vitripennis]|nr:hypothetical protein J6590_075647 [Homalodisca vitripennis]